MLLAMSVAVCLAANDKNKVSKKARVPVYDTTTGLEVGYAKFTATQDYLTVDMYITDGEPLISFTEMFVTTSPDVIRLVPHGDQRGTDEKGRTHETTTYGIYNKYESFQATLTAHTWTAGPVTLSPKAK